MKKTSTSYQIPKALTVNLQKELALKSSIVLNALSRISHFQNINEVNLSQNDLTKMTGLNRQEIRNALSELQNKNYITFSKAHIELHTSTEINNKLSDGDSIHFQIDHAKEYGVKAAILLSYVQRRIKSALEKDTSTAFFFNWVWCFNTHSELSEQLFLTSKEIKNAIKILTDAKQIVKRCSGAHGRTHFTLPDLTVLIDTDSDKILKTISKHGLNRMPDFAEQKRKAQIKKNTKKEHHELLETIKAEMFKEQINEPVQPKAEKREAKEMEVMHSITKELDYSEQHNFINADVDDDMLSAFDDDSEITKHNQNPKYSKPIHLHNKTVLEEDHSPIKKQPFLLNMWDGIADASEYGLGINLSRGASITLS